MKNIRNPEYATSKERQAALQEIVIDGEDAEAVLKYASRFLKNAEDELLTAALSTDADVYALARRYQIVHSFCTQLKQAATLGKQKQKVLDDLRKNV